MHVNLTLKIKKKTVSESILVIWFLTLKLSDVRESGIFSNIPKGQDKDERGANIKTEPSRDNSLSKSEICGMVVVQKHLKSPTV